jgi:hypothetical protein
MASKNVGHCCFFFLQVVRLIFFYDASASMDLNIESCCHLKGRLNYCDVNVLISNNQNVFLNLQNSKT